MSIPVSDLRPAVVLAPICLSAAVATTLVALLWMGTIAPQEEVRSFVKPAPVVYVNTKTGAQLVAQRPPMTLRAFKNSRARQEAAKMAVTGLLSVAAVAQPLDALAQDGQLADLMQAWNRDFGPEYGRWDMVTDARFPIRTAPNLVGQPPKAAAAVPLRVAPAAVGPIDQVVAEWNKDFGAKYGTWQPMTPTPAARKAAPVAAPARPATVTVAVAPMADVSTVATGSVMGTLAWGLAGLGAVLSLLSAAKWAAARMGAKAAEPLLALLRQEEVAVPGEYSFSMDNSGSMSLVSARREPVPSAAAAPAPPAAAPPSPPPSPRNAARQWRPRSWSTPTGQLAGAMAVTSGERGQEVYHFTRDDGGMRLVRTESAH